MDAATCLKKLEYVGVLAFATVGRDGSPQVRNISAIHYEPDALYFFHSPGQGLLQGAAARGKVQILCYTRYKEMIRLSGTARPCPPRSRKGRILIFEEQPYLSNVYPGETRGIAWCFASGTCHRVLPPGGEPHLPGELHRRPREGKAQGLHHYRGLHQLRRLCGSLPPAGHHLGRAQRHPPGALSPLRQLRGALPRGGCYTEGTGDRPSGNLTKG
mgnify:CR=1 FL=1